MKKFLLSTAAVLFLASTYSLSAQNPTPPLPAGSAPVTLSQGDATALASSLKDGMLIEKDIQISDLQNSTKRTTWQATFKDLVAKISAENHFGPNVTFDYQRFEFIKILPTSGVKPQAKVVYPVPVNLGQKPVLKAKK